MNLFIDTETTGLPRGGVQPRIVSIAWIVADVLTQHRSLRSLIVKPDGYDRSRQARGHRARRRPRPTGARHKYL
jgi:hypothetical protein